jgi:hypothetical protein
MMRAIVDARRCGQGKTLPFSLKPTIVHNEIVCIYNRIKTYADGGHVCVVLPSKASIEEYREHFEKWIEIENNHLLLRAIYKDDLDKDFNIVQAAIHSALNEKANIILITRNAFVELAATKEQREQYHLIIDEEIIPFVEVTIKETRKLNVDFRWQDNAKITHDQTQVEWPRIDFSEQLKGHAFDDSKNLRDLLNDNWISRVNYHSWQKFILHEDGERRINIVKQLRPDIMWHWASTWIACAAFEHTFMAHWMTINNLDYVTHPKLQFEPHTTAIYAYGNGNLEWSNHKQLNQPQIRQEYQQRAQPTVGNTPILVLRNKGQSKLFAHEEPLTHNTAGLNSYRHYNRISLESALNPTPEFVSYLEHVFEQIYHERSRELIHTARTNYLFYQTVMRTCLRDDKPAHVYALDRRTIAGLNLFFDNVIWAEAWPDYTVNIGEPGRPQTTTLGRALTAAERNFISRERRRNPACVNMSNEDILNLRK